MAKTGEQIVEDKNVSEKNIMKKRVTTSSYNFKDIITEDVLYVDKTRECYDMVSAFNGQFFLSRPRRFGKSLTLSALKSIFSGNKELFKGLYIYDKEYDWKIYPIIHLSMNALSAETAEEYDAHLNIALKRIAKDQGVTLDHSSSSQNFKELILLLSKTNGKVVVLIDEYDKAILDNVNNLEECKRIRTLLKQFYGQIKACEEYIRFSFITGVSKFTQVSVFSDLNNLTDITMDKNFATICGFTQEECEHYFAEWIVENAEELEMTKPAYLAKLKVWYNGIRFSEKHICVYNPVSFSKAMMNCDFKNYWFETGTPTFLLELLKDRDFDLSLLDNLKVNAGVFSSYEIENLDPIALLFQTGYLTIKDYDDKSQEYTLSYPNREVAESFSDRLISTYSTKPASMVSIVFRDLYESLHENDMDRFFDALKSYYADIDYDLKHKTEKCYQLIFYLIFSNLNYRVDMEVKTNKGRMDAVVETPKYIYIFEVKLDKSPEEAINQIKEREYFQKYMLSSKEVILLGVNFASDTGEVDGWLQESLKTNEQLKAVNLKTVNN